MPHLPSHSSAAGTGAGAGVAAATPITAVVPPLKLGQALPGATSTVATAAAAASSPAQPVRVSYQLSDSHGALHFVSLAEVADANSTAAGPHPASAAATTAAGRTVMQASSEQQPWTQNTARALRRTQQEVAELCAAGGLPLPAERAYCFDLVGMWLTNSCASSKMGPILGQARAPQSLLKAAYARFSSAPGTKSNAATMC
jgi:hypothetical protein